MIFFNDPDDDVCMKEKNKVRLWFVVWMMMMEERKEDLNECRHVSCWRNVYSTRCFLLTKR